MDENGGAIPWGELVAEAAQVLGVSPLTLGIALAALAGLLLAGLWALSVYCWRCGSWFALREAGTAGPSYRRGGKLRVPILLRCSVCGFERKAERSLRGDGFRT